MRTYDYFSGYKMYEDKEYFMFYSITQIDFKVNFYPFDTKFIDECSSSNV